MRTKFITSEVENEFDISDKKIYIDDVHQVRMTIKNTISRNFDWKQGRESYLTILFYVLLGILSFVIGSLVGVGMVVGFIVYEILNFGINWESVVGFHAEDEDDEEPPVVIETTIEEE